MDTNRRVDTERAASLRKMAQRGLERLESTSKYEFASLTIVDYYDALHKLMEAIALENGKSFRGEGAHERLIGYVVKQVPLATEEERFLQELREYRNAIQYTGKPVPKGYVESNETRVQALIARLRPA